LTIIKNNEGCVFGEIAEKKKENSIIFTYLNTQVLNQEAGSVSITIIENGLPVIKFNKTNKESTANFDDCVKKVPLEIEVFWVQQKRRTKVQMNQVSLFLFIISTFCLISFFKFCFKGKAITITCCTEVESQPNQLSCYKYSS